MYKRGPEEWLFSPYCGSPHPIVSSRVWIQAMQNNGNMLYHFLSMCVSQLKKKYIISLGFIKTRDL